MTEQPPANDDIAIAGDEMEAATLVSVPCPARLHDGEICHATSPAMLYQESNRISRVRRSGFSGRVRIARGISYNTGSYAVDQTRTPRLEQIASGELCVTNQRLIFLSDAKSLDLPFSRLLSCYTGPGEIEVSKSNSGRVLFEELEPNLVTVFEQVTGTSPEERIQAESQARKIQAEQIASLAESRKTWLITAAVFGAVAMAIVVWFFRFGGRDILR